MDMMPMGQMPPGPMGPEPGMMGKLGGKMSGGGLPPPQMQTTQGMNPVMDGMARGADAGFQPQATQNLANIAPPRENVGGPGMSVGGNPGIQGGAMGMNQMDPQKKMLMAQMLSKIGGQGFRR